MKTKLKAFKVLSVSFYLCILLVWHTNGLEGKLQNLMNKVVTNLCFSRHRFQHGRRRLPNTDGKIYFFLAGRVSLDSDSNYNLNFICNVDLATSSILPACCWKVLQSSDRQWFACRSVATSSLTRQLCKLGW